MSQWEKPLLRIRNNPKSVRFHDLDKVLRNNGFERRQSGKGTSHYRYVRGVDQIVVSRQGNHVKEAYVKQVVELLSQRGVDLIGKDLDYYMALPYSITVIPDLHSGGYVAKVNELPGCITQAESMSELMQMIEDAKCSWLDGALQDGIEIPEPVDTVDVEPSKFLLRLPKSLQRELAARARLDGVSLNQYMLYQLAKSVGAPVPPGPAGDEMAATMEV